MIIFSLDGTLADCEHRRHFVQRPHCYHCGNNKTYAEMVGCFCYEEKFIPDWQAFYEACEKDEPIWPTIQILEELNIRKSRIEIWSDRCESVREKTKIWLGDFCKFDDLKMRPMGDNTPDDVLKQKWLDEAIAEGEKIDFVFDSCPGAIQIWRRRGIFVFDCNQNG